MCCCAGRSMTRSRPPTRSAEIARCCAAARCRTPPACYCVPRVRRRTPRTRPLCEAAAKRSRQEIAASPRCDRRLDSLRGHEGDGGARIFRGLRADGARGPGGFRAPRGRSRRPPLDRMKRCSPSSTPCCWRLRGGGRRGGAGPADRLSARAPSGQAGARPRPAGRVARPGGGPAGPLAHQPAADCGGKTSTSRRAARSISRTRGGRR